MINAQRSQVGIPNYYIVVFSRLENFYNTANRRTLFNRTRTEKRIPQRFLTAVEIDVLPPSDGRDSKVIRKTVVNGPVYAKTKYYGRADELRENRVLDFLVITRGKLSNV